MAGVAHGVDLSTGNPSGCKDMGSWPISKLWCTAGRPYDSVPLLGCSHAQAAVCFLARCWCSAAGAPTRPTCGLYVSCSRPATNSALSAPRPSFRPAVVQIEDTEFLGAAAGGPKRVRINKQAAPGEDVRQVGPRGWQFSSYSAHNRRRRPRWPARAAVHSHPLLSRAGALGGTHPPSLTRPHPQNLPPTPPPPPLAIATPSPPPPPPPGSQIGSDMAAGEVVLRAGQHVGAAEVGILATVGATTVK